MIIHFYEKPGCINNTKQKKLLEESGHTVIAHSILTQSWTPETLRKYFGSLSIVDWFNPASPRIKNGEIIPEKINEATALQHMVKDPILIRRPLINAQGELICGFDNKAIVRLTANKDIHHLLTCPNLEKDTNCNNSISKISFDL
ncbi:nitrogenase-associated protein [Paludibacter propionicigenes WB4]|uniref:Nitrogenase-associated protein n=1 Tax=Paludibacter propionicigenes (strain DSM 17365 / JCM 13257 / WB4) TaxID=694427 RepID=E4T4B4_PALPW|nr:ArsC/Spx/MgsR family protein [Paludibacter propionicigenes]ADQ79558.1 nitrogenase-associated protein [Paludibacter propionicigenes WB4]